MSFKNTKNQRFIFSIILVLVGATRSMMIEPNEQRSDKSDPKYQVLANTRLKIDNFELFYYSIISKNQKSFIRFFQVYYHSKDQIYKREINLSIDESLIDLKNKIEINVYHNLDKNNLVFIKSIKIKPIRGKFTQTNYDDDDHKSLNLRKLFRFCAGDAFKLSILKCEKSKLDLVLSQKNQQDKVTLYIKKTKESVEEKESEEKVKKSLSIVKSESPIIFADNNNNNNNSEIIPKENSSNQAEFSYGKEKSAWILCNLIKKNNLI